MGAVGFADETFMLHTAQKGLKVCKLWTLNFYTLNYFRMKKYFLIFISIFFVISQSFSQKFVYVDTEYILSKLPEYSAAQQQLDNMSAQWQKDVEAKYAEIEKLTKTYQAEQILLTEEMRKKRETEITNKEKEARDFQKIKFGIEGELFKKRQELVRPVQDKVYDAIKELAKKDKFAIVFDKSGSLTMLFTDEKYDKSGAILKALGVKDEKSKKSSDKSDKSGKEK